jgi:hypothetical protein
MLQGGTLVVEMEALLSATSITRAELQEFMADAAWQFPKAGSVKARQLHRIFDERRTCEQNPSLLKGNCSEFLGMYGMMRCFVALKLSDLPAAAACKGSFEAACEVVDCMLALKRCTVSVADGAAKLEASLRRHLAAHVAVYGDRRVLPKHHWMMDVPAQVRRDQVVLDAFVVERIHLRVKSAGEAVDNTTHFERSVLSSLLVKSTNQADVVSDGLVGRAGPLSSSHSSVKVADKLRVFGSEISVEDVVVRDGTAAKVLGCADQGSELFLLVKQYVVVTPLALHCFVGREQERISVWKATAAVLAVAWRPRSDGTVIVVTQ